jgi:hypothetical protein
MPYAVSFYDEIFMKHDKEKVAKLLKEDIINLKPFSEFYSFPANAANLFHKYMHVSSGASGGVSGAFRGDSP